MMIASLAIKPPDLRTPPINKGDPRAPSPAVRATVFPRWFACDAIAGRSAKPSSARPLSGLGASESGCPRRARRKKRRGFADPFCLRLRERSSARHRLAPCRPSEREGRGDDAADKAGACRKPIWLEDSGTSADPRDTRVVCECGASLSLEELFQPGRLGACLGERPWIAPNDRDPNACDKTLRLLTRSATNTYFPQIARVISLPQAVDALARNLETVWTDISECKTVEDVETGQEVQQRRESELQGHSDEEILARILSIASGAAQN